eukprot:TRINITY_DN6764_c0_g1_i1.p1 TRINITY_DN6764_c0_g1~~TRINITY_DN6764_c0_g1_i1.p1  ORF type:complete len:312 (-),score=38.77 TRINITY_DN6764_c0_g1_i1:106-1020(-)
MPSVGSDRALVWLRLSPPDIAKSSPQAHAMGLWVCGAALHLFQLRFGFILRYLRTLLYHKFAIVLSGVWLNWKLRRASSSTGWRLRIPLWRLLCHDWVKFTPNEFMPYARRFCLAGFLDDPSNRAQWDRAFAHHVSKMDHHWQHFHPDPSHPSVESEEASSGPSRVRPMPAAAVLESAADSLGAELAYSGRWPQPETWQWLDGLGSHEDRRYHPASRALLCAAWHCAGFPAPMLELTWNAAIQAEGNPSGFVAALHDASENAPTTSDTAQFAALLGIELGLYIALPIAFLGTVARVIVCGTRKN